MAGPLLITMPSQTFTRKVAIYETGNQGRNLLVIVNMVGPLLKNSKV